MATPLRMRKLPFKAHTQFDSRGPSAADEALVDLFAGAPSVDLLPHDLMRDAAALALSEDQTWAGEYADELTPGSMLQYGPIKGDSTVKEALASFLSRHNARRPGMQTAVDPSHLLLTPGASSTLLWILLALTRPGSYTLRAFMPKATYHLSFATLRDVGFTFAADATEAEPGDVEGIEEDADGLNVDVLASRLSALDSKASPRPPAREDKFRYLLYLVPTFSNPTGTVLSAARRQRLIELAIQHDILIVCDDVYEYLAYTDDDARVPPMAVFDREYGNGRNVLSNGSFSKILGPGVRCGWLEGHPDLLDRVARCGAFASGGAPSALSSRLILPLLLPSSTTLLSGRTARPDATAIDEHLVRIRSTYASRRSSLVAALKEHLLPLGASLPLGEPKGGYFLWLGLPAKVSASAFMEACDDESVAVGLGSNFLVDPGDDAGTHAVRLCWAYNDEEALVEGVRRLAKAIKKASASG